MNLLQTALTSIYPPRCLGCGDLVDSDFGLCGTCWADTQFIGGTTCDMCGVPLPGLMENGPIHCDSCIKTPRSWSQGRAALIYGGMGRKLILRLKHGDRQEIARPAAAWMHLSNKEILTEKTIIAPVPLHWVRLAKRRYNQSALIAKSLAELSGLDWCPDLLQRLRNTPSLDGKSEQQRAEILTGAVKVNAKRRHRIIGRRVLLVDDVMTTGATLEACASVCRAAGADDVCVSVLARTVKAT